ncbi:hypothetical protein BLAT2472_20536 [Burkholderia latens]
MRHIGIGFVSRTVSPSGSLRRYFARSEPRRQSSFRTTDGALDAKSNQNGKLRRIAWHMFAPCNAVGQV